MWDKDEERDTDEEDSAQCVETFSGVAKLVQLEV